MGDKSSVGDSVTTSGDEGVGKHNSEKKMTLELEIFNLNA